MGNLESQLRDRKNVVSHTQNNFIPINDFKFMDPFEDDSTNGLFFKDIYLPEEIITDILSYIPPKSVLNLTLVCKKWCNIIKSENFWMTVYNKRYPTKAKRLPWYVYYCYFSTNNFKENFLRNGNGKEKFKHWKIIKNFGNQFVIEKPPCGSDPLPQGVSEFNGNTSCFATSFDECNKVQIISLKEKRLLRYILSKFTPHFYVSEWVAGRFDCGCTYRLTFKGYDDDFNESDLDIDNLNEEPGANYLFRSTTTTRVQQWEGRSWEKVELLINEYPPGVAVLVFEHEGRDTQFWAGHYGSKMAGGVVRIIFDSIEPKTE